MSEIITISAPIDGLMSEQDPPILEQLPIDEAAKVQGEFNDIVDAIDVKVDKDLIEELRTVPVMKAEGAGDIIRRGSSPKPKSAPGLTPELSRE